MIQFVDKTNLKPKAAKRSDKTLGVCLLEVERVGVDIVITMRRKHEMASGRINYSSLAITLPPENQDMLEAWISFNKVPFRRAA